MSSSSLRHKNRVSTYPTLRRDIDCLFPVEASDFDPIKDQRGALFKHPRFNIVLPDLGRFAVRKIGLGEAVNRIEKLKTGLPKTITYGIFDLEINPNGKYFQVLLKPDETTSTNLNEERIKASNILESTRIIRFYDIQIANLTSIEPAQMLVSGIEKYLSTKETNLHFELHKPELLIKTG